MTQELVKVSDDIHPTKKKLGPPFKYDDDEVRQAYWNECRKKYKAKPWRCELCNFDSTIASRYKHCKTKRHIKQKGSL